MYLTRTFLSTISNGTQQLLIAVHGLQLFMAADEEGPKECKF